ncbi:hypothetical protein D3C72_1632710 [compost metagenome]
MHEPWRVGLLQRLCIRIGGDEINAADALGNHVVDRVAATATDADDGDIGRVAGNGGARRLGHRLILFLNS